MKKMTTIAAAVTLATVSASAGAWWANPWADQARMLDAQREYTEKLTAEQTRVAQQMAALQAQVQDAQRKYTEQFLAEQTRINERMAAQQAEAQAAQRKYAEQFAAAQARIAEHMAAQQAAAQAAQLEYARLLTAQQTQAMEAQRSFMQPMVANPSAPAQDAEAAPAMLPPGSFAAPYRMDPLTWTFPLSPYGDPLDSALKERLKASEARREESRKAMQSRREAALKKYQERRLARPHYVDLRRIPETPAREEI